MPMCAHVDEEARQTIREIVSAFPDDAFPIDAFLVLWDRVQIGRLVGEAAIEWARANRCLPDDLNGDLPYAGAL